MERDVAIAHGASAFLRERLMGVSDEYPAVFCIICGIFAINDQHSDSYKTCISCGNKDQFGTCSIPYVLKLLIQLLAPAGIFLRPEFITNAQYAAKVLPKNKSMGLTEDEYDEKLIDEIEEEEEDDDADIQLEEQADDDNLQDEYNERDDYEGYDYEP